LIFSISVEPGGTPNNPETPFASSGLLDPGRYRLFARAFSCSNEGPCGQSYGRSAYSFSFIVPEPTPAALLGVGLMMIALARRR
jgi:hypothetical protein